MNQSKSEIEEKTIDTIDKVTISLYAAESNYNFSQQTLKDILTIKSQLSEAAKKKVGEHRQ